MYVSKAHCTLTNICQCKSKINNIQTIFTLFLVYIKNCANCPEVRYKESILSVITGITVWQQTLKYSKAKRFKRENGAEPGITMSSICEPGQQHEWQTRERTSPSTEAAVVVEKFRHAELWCCIY